MPKYPTSLATLSNFWALHIQNHEPSLCDGGRCHTNNSRKPKKHPTKKAD